MEDNEFRNDYEKPDSKTPNSEIEQNENYGEQRSDAEAGPETFTVTEQQDEAEAETEAVQSSNETEEIEDDDFDDDYSSTVDKKTTRKGVAVPVVAGLMIGSAFMSAMAASFVVPYLYGSNPQEVYGIARGLQGSGVEIIKGNQTNSPAKIIRVDNNGVSNPVAAVAQKLQQSVVNVKTKQPQKYMGYVSLIAGSGSGVIYSENGYILTNNHVVANATEIIVTIGKEEVKAKLIATDSETDLAVLKVDKTGLQPAEFGSTKSMQVGDLAVAIGSPFGLEHTVTSGIISAMNRTVSVPDEQNGVQYTYVNLIQTDASINPGNSGGALSDSEGRVIGINALILSSSGASEGVGFAIPSEIVQRVADQLINGGKASHAYIGITGHDVSDVFAGENKTSVKHGAQVVDVVSGSPADKAGLKQQDIIVAVDGQEVNDMNELIAAIRMKQVGESAKITIYRGSKKLTVELKLAEKPKQLTD